MHLFDELAENVHSILLFILVSYLKYIIQIPKQLNFVLSRILYVNETLIYHGSSIMNNCNLIHDMFINCYI